MGLGHFRVCDILRLGTFFGLGRFGVGTFCSWDVLELGPFVLGRFVVGHFVLGRFVGAPFSRDSIEIFSLIYPVVFAA